VSYISSENFFFFRPCDQIFSRDVSAYSSYDQWCCSARLKCVKGLSCRKIYVLCELYRAQGKSKPDCVHNFPVGIIITKYEVHSRVQIALSHTVCKVIYSWKIDESIQIVRRGCVSGEGGFFNKLFYKKTEKLDLLI